MKKIQFWFVSLVAIFLFGCEEVIDLDLDTAQKQLVIDASLDWDKNATSNIQKIYLSYTMPFYTTSEPEKASGASVKVRTYDGQEFIFTEETQGEYVCNNFSPEIDKDYLLHIDYQGNIYSSKARMREAVTIEESHITQTENAGFSNDEKELKISFQTDASQNHSYMIRVYSLLQEKEFLFALSDVYFTRGKMAFNVRGTNIDKPFEKGEKLEISLFRISEQYKQIIDHFINSSLERGSSATTFTAPKRILGNITNENNPKQPPLGAFRVAQFSKITYEVK